MKKLSDKCPECGCIINVEDDPHGLVSCSCCGTALEITDNHRLIILEYEGTDYGE